MRQVTIKTSDSQKGRAFSALELATVEADPLWSRGSTNTDNIRPVWALFTGSESEMRSFAANLRAGRKIETGQYSRKETIEFLKSAGYQYTWQRFQDGSTLTVFLPDLFRLDPGLVDPKGISFIVLPPMQYLTDQVIDPTEAINHINRICKVPTDFDLAGMLPMSALFCAYLDRRTRCPLVADMRFYLQLYLACITQGLASWSVGDHYYRNEFGQHRHIGYKEKGVAEVGLHPGVAFDSTHDQFETLLAEQVQIYFAAIK